MGYKLRSVRPRGPAEQRVPVGAVLDERIDAGRRRERLGAPIGDREPERRERLWQITHKMKAGFPPGLDYSVPFNTTMFVHASIQEVFMTLLEAGLLVLIVIVIFLQDWRAMLVPATTIPVTIIGAFAAMAALGFTINLSTMFGIVLAIESIRVVPQQQAWVVERIGRFHSVLEPGLNVIWPFFDTVAYGPSASTSPRDSEAPSDSSRKGSRSASLNSASRAGASGETPITVTSCAASRVMLSRKSHACFVHPGVIAAG